MFTNFFSNLATEVLFCESCPSLNTAGDKCRDADYSTCKAETLCDGKTAICPMALVMSDGAACIDGLVLSLWLTKIYLLIAIHIM